MPTPEQPQPQCNAITAMAVGCALVGLVAFVAWGLANAAPPAIDPELLDAHLRATGGGSSLMCAPPGD